LLCHLPSVSDALLSLQLWREAVDGLVRHSVRLRSQLGLPERDTCVDVGPEGRGEWWLQHSRRTAGTAGTPKNLLNFNWNGSFISFTPKLL